jgi:hypothetical protein
MSFKHVLILITATHTQKLFNENLISFVCVTATKGNKSFLQRASEIKFTLFNSNLNHFLFVHYRSHFELKFYSGTLRSTELDILK